MKRTNLVLNEKFLHDAMVLLGLKTYSEVVNRALEQTIKTIKIREMADYFGQGIWEGNLSKMREDRAGDRAQ